MPGKISPGIPQLDDDSDQTEREHQRNHVRIDQQVEGALPEGHLDALDRRTGRVQGDALRARCLTVDLVEQLLERGCDLVDHALRERLAGAEVGRGADHRLGGGGVAVMLPRELADVRCGVVDDLPPEIARELLAGGGDGCRGADVRLWSHCEHVRCLPDHGPCRVGARSGRCDVDDHGRFERQHRLDDVAHRRAETPRGVHLDHDRVVALPLRTLHDVLEIVLRDGVDVVVELRDEHPWRVVGRSGGKRDHEERCGESERARDGSQEWCVHRRASVAWSFHRPAAG